MTDEIPLTGGNVNTVVRVGDTVRRVCGPWSTTVQQLLLHLERTGFAGAPRFLGIDDRGREILTFIPGDVGFLPYIWDDAAVVAAAQLLRQLHDASAGFVAPPAAHWQLPSPDAARHEVICHNDFAPYNLVFVGELPHAIIDFDTAGPGPRAWDVAFALYWFVPLYHNDLPTAPGLGDLASAAARLQLFCDAYGIPADATLLELVERRLHALCIHLITRALHGEAVYRTMLAEGHLAGYQRAILDLQQAHPQLLAALHKSM